MASPARDRVPRGEGVLADGPAGCSDPPGVVDGAVYGPETFLARAADGGMAPWIEAGDFVWVDPDEPAVDGSVVLFGYGPEAVVRLLKVEDGRRTLRAVNGDWAEIVVDADNETGIRGVVVFRGWKV